MRLVAALDHARRSGWVVSVAKGGLSVWLSQEKREAEPGELPSGWLVVMREMADHAGTLLRRKPEGEPVTPIQDDVIALVDGHVQAARAVRALRAAMEYMDGARTEGERLGHEEIRARAYWYVGLEMKYDVGGAMVLARPVLGELDDVEVPR